MSILKRLKERKLVQWALAYLAGAWVVLQVFQSMQEGLGLSRQLFGALVVVLGAGLILTLVLGWYHGEQGRQRVSGPELLILAGILSVTALLLRELGDEDPSISERNSVPVDAEVPPPLTGRPAIAVLPLENLSEQAADEHFVDGIHHELMAQLGNIRSLDIKSRTSVLPYRDSPKNVRTIGQELGAAYIVEGSVQRAGSSIRLFVRLQRADDDAVVWSDSYTRELTVDNVLDLQTDVALQIATQVGAEVLPRERAQLDVRAPDNWRAYESYLDGLSHQSIVELGLASEAERIQAHRDAISHLQEAIALEPEWAPPWAVLARTYHFMASRHEIGGVGIDRRENFEKSRNAIDTALGLDSLHAPAWNSLAFIRQRWERDFLGAEAAYERAEELGGVSGLWGWGDGMLYTSWARFEPAIAAYERAISYNPIASTPRYRLGMALACAGDHLRAIAHLRQTEAIFGDPSGWLTYAYLKAGRSVEGLSHLATLRRSGTADLMLPLLYALADSTDRAEALLAEAAHAPLDLDGTGPVAAAFVVLGQEERALDYLERVAESDPLSLIDIQCTEEVRTLEGNDRYEGVLDRFGFPR